MLLYGPEGTGKRSLALWTAALLQCSSDEARPCGVCRDCRMAGRLEHPDIHLHFPMPRPKQASSRAKLREAMESLRSERLALLRENPFSVLDEGEVTGIYLAAVENIRAQAARRPAMSGKAIFVVVDADRMVPQHNNNVILFYTGDLIVGMASQNGAQMVIDRGARIESSERSNRRLDAVRE